MIVAMIEIAVAVAVADAITRHSRIASNATGTMTMVCGFIVAAIPSINPARSFLSGITTRAARTKAPIGNVV